MRVIVHSSASKRVKNELYKPENGAIIVSDAVLNTLFVAAGGWIVWQAWRFFFHALASSQASTQAVIIAGSMTILGSVLTMVFTAKNQKRREIEAEHREKKSKLYEEFMEFWLGTLMREKLGEEPATEKEMFHFFHKFNQQMIVWGSDKVFKQYLIFRSRFQNAQNMKPSEALGVLEDLLLAMRVDLGHANKGLKQHDLLRLFINDVDEMIVAGNSSVHPATPAVMGS